MTDATDGRPLTLGERLTQHLLESGVEWLQVHDPKDSVSAIDVLDAYQTAQACIIDQIKQHMDSMRKRMAPTSDTKQ